jgi:hypothetical protein
MLRAAYLRIGHKDRKELVENETYFFFFLIIKVV